MVIDEHSGSPIYEGNVRRVRELGFSWLRSDPNTQQLPHLGITGRVLVTCYFQSEGARMLASYCVNLGLSVRLDMALFQIGWSCGVCSAVVIAQRQALGSLFFDDGPVLAAVDREAVALGYDWLQHDCGVSFEGRPTITANGIETPYRSDTMVAMLMAKYLQQGSEVLSTEGTAHEIYARAHARLASTADLQANDAAVFNISRAVKAAATDLHPGGSTSVRSMSVNVQPSHMRGSHWFSVSYDFSKS